MKFLLNNYIVLIIMDAGSRAEVIMLMILCIILFRIS